MVAKDTTNTKFLMTLGLPSLGLSFAVTTLSAYLPTILHDLASPVMVGLIIGAEGFFGLFMPVLMGNIADRADKVVERLKYLAPAVAAMAVALVLMGFLHKLALIGLLVAIFYIGYFTYLPPYWALYPDLIPDSHSGRSRSAESIWRGIGAIAALIGSGLLIGVWKPLPFIASAILLVAVTLLLSPILGRHGKTTVAGQPVPLKQSFASVYSYVRGNRSLRNLMIANSLWNATLRSILAFTVLFFTVGLHRSHSYVAAIIFPIAGIGMAVMMPLAGKMADAVGYVRVLMVALLVYGSGLLVAGITQKSWVIWIIPVVSAAAATVMVLPYAWLMRLLDDEGHGMASGLFGVSRGVGAFLGPLVTGLAVVLCRNMFPSTDGYAAFWWVSGLYILISLFFIRGIHKTRSA